MLAFQCLDIQARAVQHFGLAHAAIATLFYEGADAAWGFGCAAGVVVGSVAGVAVGGGGGVVAGQLAVAVVMVMRMRVARCSKDFGEGREDCGVGGRGGGHARGAVMVSKGRLDAIPGSRAGENVEQPLELGVEALAVVLLDQVMAGT